MSRSPTILAAVALSVAVAHAAPARAAGPDTADALFDHGVEQMEAGHFDKACPAIELSYKVDPLPGTLFALAECEAKRGRLATALSRYEEYLAIHATLPPEKKHKQGDREKVSREAKAALAPQAPEVTITLPAAAPSGTVLTRDGAPLAATALGVPMRLDPGDHVFTTQPPGGPVTEKVVTVKPMDRKTVLLEVAAVASPAPVQGPITPPPPRDSPPQGGPSGRRIAVFVSGGAGAAALVMGAVTGGLAIGKKSVVNQSCGINGDPTACNHTGLTAADSLKTLGLVSTIGFVVAGAGLATGVVLFATEPKAKDAAAAPRAAVRVALSAGGAVVEGAW